MIFYVSDRDIYIIMIKESIAVSVTNIVDKMLHSKEKFSFS